MAHGSFYTYFASRQDVFVAVMRAVGEQFRVAVAAPPSKPRTGVYTALDRANRRYLEAYRANSVIWALAEQVATMDAEIHRIRLRGRIEHVERVAKTIRRWQDQGLAEPASTRALRPVPRSSRCCPTSRTGGSSAGTATIPRPPRRR